MIHSCTVNYSSGYPKPQKPSAYIDGPGSVQYIQAHVTVLLYNVAMLRMFWAHVEVAAVNVPYK